MSWRIIHLSPNPLFPGHTVSSPQDGEKKVVFLRVAQEGGPHTAANIKNSASGVAVVQLALE